LDTTRGAEAAIDSLHFNINNLEHGDHGNRGPAVQPPYEAADPRETIHQTPETFLPDDENWDELFELFSTEHIVPLRHLITLGYSATTRATAGFLLS